VLEATRDLLVEVGYERLTVDGIAARAGVSKMTIYRWWSAKAEIVAEATLSGAITIEPMQFPDTGDLAVDLRTWIRAVVATPLSPEVSALALAMTAATTADPQIGVELYSRFTGRDRSIVLARLRSAFADNGETCPVFEPIVDSLFGLLLFRLVTRAQPDLGYADALTDFVLAGLGIHSAP
jgi:AcrR family transcriptional regulator